MECGRRGTQHIPLIVYGFGLGVYKMKRIRPFLCAMLMAAPVLGQESGSRGTTNGSGGNDLLDELWYMQDANPIETGRWDMRLTF